jgi:hypothetical protein
MPFSGVIVGGGVSAPLIIFWEISYNFASPPDNPTVKITLFINEFLWILFNNIGT